MDDLRYCEILLRSVSRFRIVRLRELSWQSNSDTPQVLSQQEAKCFQDQTHLKKVRNETNVIFFFHFSFMLPQK